MNAATIIEPTLNGQSASGNKLPLIQDEVIRRCQAGDLEAYEELYRKSRSFLYSLAYRFYGNREDAEDALQETFVQLYRNIRHFHGESKFTTWLYRVTLNTCISLKRKRKPRETSTDFREEAMHPAQEADTPDALLIDFLEREISLLPDLQRSVFLLYATEGLTHPEIADALDIRIGTSKSYYHRARGVLKKRLIEERILSNRVEQ